ncbi:hypothetical protein GCM10027572_19620 [Flexivirga lutea]
MGQTSVTTAPGIALTLIRSGVLPLPVLPRTGFGLSFSHGSLAATYRFPITGGDPDLAGPSGDIHHDGGIYFAGRRSHLEIGRFDIDLSAGKIFADQVDFRGAHLPVLDLDLSGLKVDQHEGRTVLSGIGLKLDPAAANALNSTFDLGLPTDGSLLFGTGQVTLKSGPCNTWPR